MHRSFYDFGLSAKSHKAQNRLPAQIYIYVMAVAQLWSTTPGVDLLKITWKTNKLFCMNQQTVLFGDRSEPWRRSVHSCASVKGVRSLYGFISHSFGFLKQQQIMKYLNT